MAPQQLAQPAVRIAHIADDPRPAHARLHARRQQSRFQPVHAEGAFVRRLGGVIDKTGIVRTGLHAIGAPHAAFVVDHHDPVLALEGGLHRAYRHAGRVVAVVAQPGQQHVGRYFFPFEADLVLVYRGAKLPVRRLVFNGAAHGTGLAPDTAPQVDQHRIASANIPLRRVGAHVNPASAMGISEAPAVNTPSRCKNCRLPKSMRLSHTLGITPITLLMPVR